MPVLAPGYYCIHTQPKWESLVSAAMIRQGFPVVLPLALDDKGRTSPLFPRYFFAWFDCAGPRWEPLYHEPGVICLLTIGGIRGKPSRMPDDSVETLLRLYGDKCIVDNRVVVSPLDWHTKELRIKNESNPYYGWTGLCTMTSKKRVEIMLEIFGAQRRVEFSVNDVELVQ